MSNDELANKNVVDKNLELSFKLKKGGTLCFLTYIFFVNTAKLSAFYS